MHCLQGSDQHYRPRLMDATLIPRRDEGYPDTPDSATPSNNRRPSRPLQGRGTTIITMVDIYLPERVEGSYLG